MKTRTQKHEVGRRDMPLRRTASPTGAILRVLASLSRVFRRDLTSFCDLATCDGSGLITFGGDYATVLRIGGLRRLATKQDIIDAARGLRDELVSLFTEPGHALQFCYAADPDAAHDVVERNLADRRAIARALNAGFEDIFSERARVLTPYMREERIWLVLWTRPGRLSRPEQKLAARRQKRDTAMLPPIGDAQNPCLSNPELATIHTAFVGRVMEAMSKRDVLVDELPPRDGLRAIREEILPETASSTWTPSTPLDRPPQHIPDEDRPADISDMLWPPLREQLFLDDAYTRDFSTIRIGVNDWTPVDMTRAPDPNTLAPFTELAARMAQRRMPWRMGALIEGVRPGYMNWKAAIATFLKFGTNRAIHIAFQELDAIRARQGEAITRLRVSFATRASTGDDERLGIRASRLQQAIGAWGGASATRVCGDPLAGVMSSSPGLAIASTAPPTAAPLTEALALMPWARQASPWRDGAIMFRAADGKIVFFDPSGAGRGAVLDLFVGPSRRGKSVLDNALLLGTLLSNASMSDEGPRIPMIGKLDVGDSTSGFVDMAINGLRPEDRHLALHVPFQLIVDHAYNIFDTEACCRKPLSYHRTFLENFLSLVCTPLDGKAFESMNQLISAVITGVYELYSDEGPSVRPKTYRAGMRPDVDARLDSLRIDVAQYATWWDIADAFAQAGDMRFAHFATQQAVPVMADLLDAIREDRIRIPFEKPNPTGGQESTIDIFRRYITSFISRYPTLNQPTRLDLGDARIIVVDIARVAPEGHGESQRQTELMFLLGFQIMARNFFLDPDEAHDVPEHVRPHHERRFREFRESFKRIGCDEFQRTAGAPLIQRQFEEAARRAAKLNVKIGLASQKLGDFGTYLIQHSTGRFILGAANPDEATEIAETFRLTPAGHQIVETGLTGPRQDGAGSPLLLQILVHGAWYELHVLNLMGPIELWALSTTPEDTALRRRVYDALGTTEARRRLAQVFPRGTALTEIERRKQARTRQGETATVAMGGVVSELACEIINGTGLGTVIREEKA
ncbi:type IV secretion protein DotO [Komagataeibacter saccharivorans]|uniref:type IV secretion protein DotO n=1 Tax=Komagataeibacter saccharivorans TaxID=265959 RepID=UPI000C84ED87|nr:type IV secretion protein DotO [Komagataeibacter saccharivorans]